MNASSESSRAPRHDVGISAALVSYGLIAPVSGGLGIPCRGPEHWAGVVQSNLRTPQERVTPSLNHRDTLSKGDVNSQEVCRHHTPAVVRREGC